MDADSLEALERIESEPWVQAVIANRGGVRLRLSDELDRAGGRGARGGRQRRGPTCGPRARAARLGAVLGRECDQGAARGHLRNLAIGNALAAALAQAGAQVERRSRISDMGRAMGEAMAGVMQSGRHTVGWSDADEKSDHFVGLCYAEYVGASGVLAAGRRASGRRTPSRARCTCRTTPPTI